MKSEQKTPILYTFRRCPYAIRARIALSYAGVKFEVREVDLKDKPQILLSISPKGTVPVLQLSADRVIEESLDIMLWTIDQYDPEGWLDPNHQQDIFNLINETDIDFKSNLDDYKYAENPMKKCEALRRCEVFLESIEQRLCKHHFLFSDDMSLADVAIFPFVRQFSKVSDLWFEGPHFERVKQWLEYFSESELFKKAMNKYPVWQQHAEPIYFEPLNASSK